jgi:hypothetical protein
VNGHERLPEWAQNRKTLALFQVVEQRRADPDSLVQDAQTYERPGTISNMFEDRERTPEKRVETGRRLDHDELTRGGLPDDRGRRKRDPL